MRLIVFLKWNRTYMFSNTQEVWSVKNCWMQILNNACDEVFQKGRRGLLLKSVQILVWVCVQEFTQFIGIIEMNRSLVWRGRLSGKQWQSDDYEAALENDLQCWKVLQNWRPIQGRFKCNAYKNLKLTISICKLHEHRLNDK